MRVNTWAVWSQTHRTIRVWVTRAVRDVKKGVVRGFCLVSGLQYRALGSVSQQLLTVLNLTLNSWGESGWQDGSTGKSACPQAWQPDFNPWPQVVQDPNSTTCLSVTHAARYLCTHPQHPHMRSKVLEIYFFRLNVSGLLLERTRGSFSAAHGLVEVGSRQG